MAGFRGKGGGTGGAGRGEDERRREREARERARARRDRGADEQSLQARADERQAAALRAAAAERQAQEARAAADRWRRAQEAEEPEPATSVDDAAAAPTETSPASPAERVPTPTSEPSPEPAPTSGATSTSPSRTATPRPTSDQDPFFEPFDFAAPATRAGRERQAVFAPARPAEPTRRAEAGAAPGATPSIETTSVRDETDRVRPPRRSDAGPGAGAKAGAGALIATGLTFARRRPREALLVLAAFGLVGAGVGIAAGLGGHEADQPRSGQTKAAAKKRSPYGTPTTAELPPKTRIVAFTGAPQAPEFGILGTVSFEEAAKRLDRQAEPYDRKTRRVTRAFDLIATIADAHPGPSGKYRTRQPSKVIARYLRAARRHDALLILDVQPGGSSFVDELRPLRRWLREPDVHLALDPEWRMRPGVQPGSEIGYVSAGEITATLSRVAAIVREAKIPRKMVLVHRFTDGMIKDLPAVKVPPEITGVISIDGVGSRALKEATYDRIAPTLPKPWLAGFKLFYEEDAAAGGLMYGSQVMALKPRPHVVLYE